MHPLEAFDVVSACLRHVAERVYNGAEDVLDDSEHILSVEGVSDDAEHISGGVSKTGEHVLADSEHILGGVSNGDEHVLDGEHDVSVFRYVLLLALHSIPLLAEWLVYAGALVEHSHEGVASMPVRELALVLLQTR